MTDRAHWARMLPIIQAFVDGKDIQYQSNSGHWHTAEIPSFNGNYRYRIKPEPIVETWGVRPGYSWGHGKLNLRLTFDPDTKELLTAEVIK